jgi:type I restriction-modification system DNA methylase subunit
LGFQTPRYASERDFVARFLLPKLREAAERLGVADVVDFFFEKPINGTPDLTAEKGGRGLFVVEAKFKKKVGRVQRDIEPRDPEVVRQALDYAGWGGFPYYATCNVRRLILFQRKPEAKALESEIASFEYERSPDWAESLLKTVLELVPVRLKPLDDTLVDTLHEASSDLYPEFLSALKGRLRDKKFRERYVDWLESQGVKFSDETNRLIAEQTTYLQLNKLLFYQVIRAIYPDRLRPLRIGEEEDVSEALAGFFADARKIDYAPIYQSDVISEIPLTPRAQERIRTLLDTLNEFDFSKMESDFIGRIYEKLIPPLERKRLGQFYTPPGIVDFIVQLTVTKPEAVVLDPGCGSGGFLVRAYHRLRELNHIPRVIEGPLAERFHQQLLERLYGVDINQFPAHLTVINLAVQNPKARIEKVNAVVSDIFDVRPGQATLSGFESLTAEGKPTLVEMPPAFDAVVANPPYIRQELLGEKEKAKIKSLIESEYKGKLFIGAPQKKVKGAVILDRQSDIYIYFYIHGLRFLKNGGRLGFISSNKWLEVGYGEPFQQFLLDSAKILYVVEFDRAVFPDAEVDTAITIVEKESNKVAKKANEVKFVRVKKPMGIRNMVQTIENISQSFENDTLRVNIIRQGKLKLGKWNTYLRAPPVYPKIISHPKVKKLGKIVEIFRGPTSGWNDYFIISVEKAEEWGIEDEFLMPCASSPKKFGSLIIKSDDIDEYFFAVDKPKHELRGTNALKYIEFGERLEIEVRRGSQRGRRRLPELETVKNRKPFWYALPRFASPHILFPKLIRGRFIAFYNEAKAQGSDVFYYVVVKKGEPTVLAGYLNSSVAMLLAELYGRQYTGMLDLKVYELKQLPTLDPNTLTHEERLRISNAFKQLANKMDKRVMAEEKLQSVKARSKADRDVGLFEAEARRELERAVRAEEEARKKLDEAVYDALGLTEEERRQVEEGLRELQKLRRLRTRA